MQTESGLAPPSSSVLNAHYLMLNATLWTSGSTLYGDGNIFKRHIALRASRTLKKLILPQMPGSFQTEREYRTTCAGESLCDPTSDLRTWGGYI